MVRNYFIRTVWKVFCVLFSNLFIILKIQRDKQTLLNYTFHFNRKYFFFFDVLKSFQADYLIFNGKFQKFSTKLRVQETAHVFIVNTKMFSLIYLLWSTTKCTT